MHTPSARPLLLFNNIWVYGNQPISPKPETHFFGHGACIRQGIKNTITSGMKRRKTTQQAINTPMNLADHQAPLLIDGAGGELLSGQLTVLTGHFGSGKSVLLRVLAGLLPPTSGDIWLQNEQERLHIDHMPATQWRAKVALLAQHPQLLTGSVLENLKLPYTLQAHQYHTFDIDWHIEQLATLKRHQSLLQQSTAHLSGGERQLVNSLRLLQLQPQILLLDEPTAALDQDTTQYFIHWLMHWLQADSSRALLWVTHETQAIMPFAHQHWQMQSGILTTIPTNKQ